MPFLSITYKSSPREGDNGGMRGQIQVVVLGGCGHIGLPLCIRLALAGWSVAAVDVNQEAVSAVNEGKMLFKEIQGDQLLAEALATGRFRATTDVTVCHRAPIVIFTNGLDLDEHGNPKLDALLAVFDTVVRQHASDDGLFIFRSTLYPGTMTLLQEHLAAAYPQGKMVGRLAYCPERTAEMYALEEIVQLPQVRVQRHTPTPAPPTWRKTTQAPVRPNEPVVWRLACSQSFSVRSYRRAMRRPSPRPTKCSERWRRPW